MSTWATNIYSSYLFSWVVQYSSQGQSHRSYINILARSHCDNSIKKRSHSSLDLNEIVSGSLGQWLDLNFFCLLECPWAGCWYTWHIHQLDFCDTVRSSFDIIKISLKHPHNYFYGSLWKSACVTWGPWCRGCFQWGLNQRHLEILGLMHYKWIEISLDELFSICDTFTQTNIYFQPTKATWFLQKKFHL